jgi:hypothetical protein
MRIRDERNIADLGLRIADLLRIAARFQIAASNPP